MKHIVAVNASPRVGWNTSALVREAARGAASEGAETEIFDLYRLESFTGCLSCFGCKRPPHEGECVVRDGLTPVLEAIRRADGVILGSPNYLNNLSAGFRALYERLIFQALTYQTERPLYSTRPIPALLIMTCNAPDGTYDELLEEYRSALSARLGPTRVLSAAETLQVSDYSRYNWTRFDPAARQRRHETEFPRKKEEAFRLGAELVTAP